MFLFFTPLKLKFIFEPENFLITLGELSGGSLRETAIFCWLHEFFSRLKQPLQSMPAVSIFYFLLTKPDREE